MLEGIHSTFIPCTFYKLLAEKYGEQGRDAFRVAYYHYAIRKGIHCAQQVVHEGLPLTMRSYNMYREAEGATPESIERRKHLAEQKKPIPSSGKEYTDGEYLSRCYNCDTPFMIRQFGCDSAYENWNCRHIDKMMVHAYNPDFFYEVTDTFVTSDHCTHHCMEPAICKEDAGVKRAVNAPPLGFIIWCEYFSHAESVEAMFGEDGKHIAEQVKELFISQYGINTWQEIEAFSSADADAFYPLAMQKRGSEDDA